MEIFYRETHCETIKGREGWTDKRNHKTRKRKEPFKHNNELAL